MNLRSTVTKEGANESTVAVVNPTERFMIVVPEALHSFPVLYST